ncbi:histone-lysine N-methyltransferase SETMAR [Trichonephila clavipes]|nr:histone-lysine N-methyltransferase SETMAR [Trichonephila clavipes]
MDVLEVGTINATRYCDTLTKLKEAIRKKCAGLVKSGVLWLDDRARPRSATAKKNHISTLDWERLHTQSAIYSSNLSPSDFHLFPALKKNPS